MRNPAGEMPFLEHLEELRLRILRSLAALVVGVGIGFWIVQRFRVVSWLKIPIEQYLPDGKLTVLSPTDPVLIVLKLSAVVGVVLASPVILWQLWAFMAPALYERERKALVPSLFVGLLLFLAGATLAWLLIVPKALAILLSFQQGEFGFFFTYDKYFGFVLQIVLAMGISAELPLLVILLAALGIVTPASLSRFRRVAIILAFVAGALLSPGADVFSMLMMSIPLVLLYEVGIAGAVVVHRRRLRRAASAGVGGLLLLLVLPTAGLSQQRPTPPPRPAPGQGPAGAGAQDTVTGRRLDSLAARRLGLPASPSRSFPSPDSVMAALLGREGFVATRYLADTARVTGVERRLRLSGEAMTERLGTILEAGAISYVEASCDLLADGDPRLFDKGQVLIGSHIRYDTCIERGVVDGALTTFAEMGADWFLRGNLGVDSVSSRLFASSSEITSCDQPVAHYHFLAKEVKWVSRSLLVARPAVLYVRDVPIAWLPFIFQETKPGRRSGILVPQFGFNDIVRPNSGYNRQVTDFGYYWAISDYLDAAVRFDWYANRYWRWSAAAQYNIRNRFLGGSVDLGQQHQGNGATATNIRWGHRQSFGVSTTLAVSVNYSSNTSVVSRNSLNPFDNTQQMASDLNLTKRFAWGQLTVGGRRRQTLGDDQVTQQLPSVALSPKPIALSSWATWSPTVNFSSDLSTQPKSFLTFPRPGGGVDSVEVTPRTRSSVFNLDTPFRLGSFNWRNTLVVRDRDETRPDTVTVRIPNDATADPTDSLTVVRQLAGTFQSEMDWNTGINLPLIARRTWKITPTIGISNTTGGSFAVRNAKTDGQWVTQGKRFSFGLSASPTLFAFLPGIGKVDRIRHSVSPLITWNYSPEGSIPEEYARAIARGNNLPELVSPATMRLSIGLSQNFEAKEKAAAGDTLGVTPPRKYRVLGITTSALSYDFEQAKEEGRNGWVDAGITNTFQSDLLPGFNLSVSHALWDGQVGTDSAKFDPFLQSVNAGFALSGNTFRSIGALFGLGSGPTGRQGQSPPGAEGPRPTSYVSDPRTQMQQRTLAATNQLTGARRPFSMNINFSLSRSRPLPGTEEDPVTNSNIGFSTSFSPTPFWGVSWTTQYNVTEGNFEAHILRLDRDLHDWRAGFNFVKNPNGNFAFYFSIHLIDLPDLKVDYNQSTIGERP